MKKKSLQKGKHVLTMGSACTGMGTESFALSAMRRPHHMLFACELKRHMRAFISKHHAPRKTLKDVENPTFQTVPFVNLFVACFPCQPFSLAGMGRCKGRSRRTLGPLDQKATARCMDTRKC